MSRAPANPGAPRMSGAPGPRILVVDDDEDTREMYRVYLGDAGFRVDVAENGEDALAKVCAATSLPAVVVMALSMPMMDGCAATKALKAGRRTKDVLVLVVTGDGTQAAQRRAWAAGADDVCLEPCLPAEVLVRVQRLLRSRIG